MSNGNIFTVKFRRKREGRTYYKKRIKILISEKYRFVVRKSLRNFQASLIQFDQKGDRVIFTVNSKSLHKLGWKADSGNLPSAYLIGYIAGKKALEKGIKDAIMDAGLNNSVKGSRLYAALAGAVDAGLKIPHNPEVLPDKKRLSGEHIANYASQLKKDLTSYNRQFSNYLKKGMHPEEIVKHFNEIRGKIHG